MSISVYCMDSFVVYKHFKPIKPQCDNISCNRNLLINFKSRQHGRGLTLTFVSFVSTGTLIYRHCKQIRVKIFICFILSFHTIE